ncbi:MAG TPA: ankyrin repeat domain-containing protein [Vicinamibacterales bacterium]|nr:ankyrin repeat domain-containing protein [Vicinamibacterales bacterium]
MTFALAATAHAQSPLADRIQAGDRRAALAMIAQGADVNRAQPDGTTPLHWATYLVDRELVEALLKKGARARVSNRYGASPLAEAVRVANVPLVDMLLKAGADVNAANEDGQTPLMLAARTGDVTVARLLVEGGANVNARERFHDQSAVMWAAGEAHAEMVAFLVSKGADLSARAKSTDWGSQITNEPRVQYRPSGGLTPLLYAARSGCLGCVKAMLDAGAEKWPREETRPLLRDRPNPDGMTPMIMALDNGYPGVARYLLDHGANPHTWDWWGRTALYVAVTMRGGLDSRAGARPPESLDLIKALLERGVDPNVQLAFKEPSRGGRDNRFRDDLLTTGATPLLRAAQTFDNDVVRLLLDHGALVDLPNASGVTPFMAAAGVGTRAGAGVLGPGLPDNVVTVSLETMEILRKAGADVNARITDVTSLTARIARTNTLTDRQGQTTLFFAAETGRTEVVKYLLDHGAKADVRDEAGKTPIDLVAGGRGRGAGGSGEIATMLKSAASISR